MNLVILLIAFVPSMLALFACMLSSKISRQEEVLALKQ
jgi:hypothetical protein